MNAILAATERPVRLLLTAAAIAVSILVAVPLYLWRRPHVIAQAPVATTASAPAAVDAGPPAGPGGNAVLLSEPKTLECQDPGQGHTAPGDCDRLPALEAAFADAIRGAWSCVRGARDPRDPRNKGGRAHREGREPGGSLGSLVFVADVHFRRHHRPIEVRVPVDGRQVGNADAASCARAVRQALEGSATAALAAAPHAHARYKIAIAVTYTGNR